MSTGIDWREKMSHKETKGKLKLNLVPIKALKAVARVREFGCSKYPSPRGKSYLRKVKSEDLVEAAWRHILAHNEGELFDKESQEMHLAHAATSLMMAMEIIYFSAKQNELSMRTYEQLHEAAHGDPIAKTLDEWKKT